LLSVTNTNIPAGGATMFGPSSMTQSGDGKIGNIRGVSGTLPLTFKADDGRTLKLPEFMRNRLESLVTSNYGSKEQFLGTLNEIDTKVRDRLSKPIQITDQVLKLDDKTSKILSDAFEAGNANIDLIGVDGQKIDMANYKNVKVHEVSPRSAMGKPYYTVSMDRIDDKGKVKEAGVKGYFEFPGSNLDQFVGQRLLNINNPDAQRVGMQLATAESMGLEGLSTQLRTAPMGDYPVNTILPGLSVRKRAHSYDSGERGPYVLELLKDGKPAMIKGRDGKEQAITATDPADLEDYIFQYLLPKK
jgi:hypothetical protein